MNRFIKISALLVLGFWSLPLLSSGQDMENKNPVFGNEELEEPSPREPENSLPGLLDLFIQPEGNSESENILESEVGNNAPTFSKSKSMVSVPESIPKQDFDAADFDDPFYRVRGFQENSEKVLQPGTTLDGVQFQNYGDSKKFIERFYRESGFSVDKVFGKIKYLERKGGCY
ncbi:MAG TPA: hypothetical protein DD452_04630, partial [Nitrospina sp.]|nr:hypothetical protein [Nitrospina sp.]